MAEDIQEWLVTIGLKKHGAAFVENAIDFALLPHLTDEDLQVLGMDKLGERKKLLLAIAQLRESDAASSQPSTVSSAAPPSETEAERRQLTVMFCDIVGSTELSALLDPEDLRDLMRRYQDCVAGIVARYDGHISKFLGDGVLTFFGWPRAYEDQAERAVRAGLAALDAIAKLTYGDGKALNARVGIATGQVVVGDIVGETTVDAAAVSGTTPNLAARLLEVASPGQVVIGVTTRHLIRETFNLDDTGAHQLKGFAEPVAAWCVRGESSIQGRFEASRAGQLTRFVGRDHELGLLHERWALARSGEGQVVLLSGEPGIGKSRLLEALHDRISGSAHTHLHYQCSPLHINSALHPVIGQLRRAAGFVPTDGVDQRLDKLEAMLVGLPEQIAEQAPLFAALLSLPTSRYYPPKLTPQQLRARILDTLIKQLLALAGQQPVLFVFEDSHWIDPTSRDLLEQTIGQIINARVMMVITHRPELQIDWSGNPHVMSLTLNRLSNAQGEEIVRAAGAEQLSTDIITRIVERTEGVPLFVEELTRAVLEAGAATAATNIPATLQASLTERLDRLNEAKEVAQIGAVIGRDFARTLIAEIVDAPASDLNGKLERLTESGLVLQRGGSANTVYTFKHALVRDAAYESLLRDKRQQLHGEVAEALLRKFPSLPDNEPELLAHHFTEAGEVELAITYWQRAGARAMEQSANIEAINHVNRALELLEKLPKTVDRDRVELDLQLALGAALIAPKSYSAEEVRLAFLRANALCQDTGDIDQSFKAVKGLWNCHVLRAELKTAREMAGQLCDSADRSRQPDRLLVAQRILAVTHLGLGEFEQSLEACNRGIDLYTPRHQASYILAYGEDPGLFCYGYSAWTSYFLGYPDAGLTRAQKALDIALKLPSVHARSYALTLSAMLFLWLRRFDRALECARAGNEVATEQSIVQWRALTEITIGAALTSKGKLKEGLDWTRKGRETIRSIRAQFLEIVMASTIAQAYCDCGEYRQGLELIDKAISQLTETGVGQGVVEIHRLRGNLLTALGATTDQLEAAYLEALDIARLQNAKMLELRAATDLATLWRSECKTSEAHSLLAPVYGWFTEGLDTPDLMDARALLDGLR